MQRIATICTSIHQIPLGESEQPANESNGAARAHPSENAGQSVKEVARAKLAAATPFNQATLLQKSRVIRSLAH